jgi:hypothetical protein
MRSYRGRRTLLEASLSVPWLLADMQVAHKGVATLCILRRAAFSLRSSTANLGSDRPISPSNAPSAFSCTYCCSPSRSRVPPSSHLTGMPAPATTAAWCRGPPTLAAFLHQLSPQTVLQRVPSQPPCLPWPSPATSSPELRHLRRPPPPRTTLQEIQSFQGVFREPGAYS